MGLSYVQRGRRIGNFDLRPAMVIKNRPAGRSSRRRAATWPLPDPGKKPSFQQTRAVTAGVRPRSHFLHNETRKWADPVKGSVIISHDAIVRALAPLRSAGTGLLQTVAV